MAQPLPITDDNAALVAAARRGDPDALSKLCEAHQQRVYRVCLRMLGHRDDAAEAAQDALVKIMESIEDFRGEARFSTWVTRIAMNQSIGTLRRRRVRRWVSLDAPPGHAADARGGAGDDQAASLRLRLAQSREPRPDSRVETQDEVRALVDALAELDESFRAVLVLRDVEQMDYHDIGQALDLPLGTVKSRLFRARLALRQRVVDREPGRRGAESPRESERHG